ncbi:putative PPE family protein PPE24 [Dissostichus eleginoides]|uniref:PPE family protein PPE24 n=1 Tax=Dissostichus eleginoides TaxID=100907 RepID=A0AAD9B6D6_DISEL|nr:putative PPE family protein PPE24 [Dissostichus eleginoides]
MEDIPAACSRRRCSSAPSMHLVSVHTSNVGAVNQQKKWMEKGAQGNDVLGRVSGGGVMDICKASSEGTRGSPWTCPIRKRFLTRFQRLQLRRAAAKSHKLKGSSIELDPLDRHRAGCLFIKDPRYQPGPLCIRITERLRVNRVGYGKSGRNLVNFRRCLNAKTGIFGKKSDRSLLSLLHLSMLYLRTLQAAQPVPCKLLIHHFLRFLSKVTPCLLTHCLLTPCLLTLPAHTLPAHPACSPCLLTLPAHTLPAHPACAPCLLTPCLLTLCLLTPCLLTPCLLTLLTPCLLTLPAHPACSHPACSPCLLTLSAHPACSHPACSHLPAHPACSHPACSPCLLTLPAHTLPVHPACSPCLLTLPAHTLPAHTLPAHTLPAHPACSHLPAHPAWSPCLLTPCLLTLPGHTLPAHPACSHPACSPCLLTPCLLTLPAHTLPAHPACSHPACSL